MPTPSSLSKGWLIGCISGGSPFWGLQIIMGLPFALWFRANIPIMLFLILLTNPITIPIYYTAAYLLGDFLLGEGDAELKVHDNPTPTASPLGSEFDLTEGFLSLLLGCSIIGATLGITGYVLIRLLWRPQTNRK